MKSRRTHSLRDITYIGHALNASKSKTAFSFQKDERFKQPLSHSPNKFYDPGQTSRTLSFSMGKGSRPRVEKPDFVPPTKYTIVSEFQRPKHCRHATDSFGISRESYYKGRSDNNLVGPGAYNVSSDLGNKPFYIGQKLKPIQSKINPKINLNITGDSLYKLSTHPCGNAAIRLKTEYFPKHELAPYDNRVPGPGTYEQTEKLTCRTKNSLTAFGATQRLKVDKPNWLGPGSYDIFSQFGRNE